LFRINNKINPSIEELREKEDFELIAELSHHQIKDFVKNHITEESRIIRYYMVYQILMVLTGLYFIIRSIFLAFTGIVQPIIFSASGLAFTLTLLVIIHELLHGFALKITGAKRIAFGGFIRKFIFYAEADRHVMNRKQFAFVALTPFVVIKLITLAGIIILYNQPALYFPMVVMTAHSLFCAGDIVLLSYFYRFPGCEIFSYDERSEKKSYFYKRTKVIQ